MERNFKNILLLLLIEAAGTAYAWEDCGTNIQYDIQGSTLVLNSPDPTLPATIESKAFKNNEAITSVTFPENVTTIEGQAFMGCTALTDIDGWDDDNIANTTNGTGVSYHGFYGKTHIGDATSGEQHLNLFLGGGNQLYWPEENDATSMLGFRAWFQIANSGASYSPVRRGMPAALRIVATPTGIDSPFPSGEGRGEAATIVLRNGQLVILRNGQTFSLNGQKL